MKEKNPAAVALGSIRTKKKAEKSRINGALGGRPQKDILDLECKCTAGDSLEGHKTYCPRGRAIKRRRAANKPL